MIGEPSCSKDLGVDVGAKQGGAGHWRQRQQCHCGPATLVCLIHLSWLVPVSLLIEVQALASATGSWSKQAGHSTQHDSQG